MVPPRPALHLWWRRLGGAFIAVALGFLALQARARAQDTPIQDTDWTGDVPAHIAVVDGTASLERDGQVIAAEENVPLLAGDRLRTDRGRAEVLFGDGSALDLDEYAAVDFLSDSLLRLRAGRIRLSIPRLTETLNYRVDAAGASALIGTAGEYRLSVSDRRASVPELDLAVVRGTAELSSPLGRTLVRAGMHAFASERTEPSLPYLFNASIATAFDRWADDQQDARLGAESARYLPADIRAYGGALDQNGIWQYEPTYGYVWFPRVATDWRPYYDGRWSDVGSLGWVWVGVDRWSWPTHHYGRWNVAAGRWFWIPDRRWGPAWVSWAVSPSYVSWCPLGFDGRPAVPLATPSRYGDARHAWTIVPARTFTADVVVSRHAVANQTLPPTALSEFAVRRAGPASPGAHARVEPLRSPTGGRATAITRDPVTRRAPGVVVTSPATSEERPRATSRAIVPPGPASADPPATPRAPADPARPRAGEDSSSTTRVGPMYGAPSRGATGRSSMRPEPNPGAAAPATRRVPPPAPGYTGNSQPPATPPPAARGGSRGTPPSGAASPPPASGSGRAESRPSPAPPPPPSSARGRTGGSPPPSPPPGGSQAAPDRRGGRGGGAR